MPSTTSIPKRFDDATLDDYKPTGPSGTKAIEAARDLIEERTLGLVLSGPTGVGKTHIAAAVYNAITADHKERLEKTVERWKTERPGYYPMMPPDPLWLNVADTISGMRLEMDLPFDDRRHTEALLRARDHEGLVILDDLGREKVSDWTGEQVYALVNARYEDLLPTMVTTNLTGEELAASPYWPVISRLAEDGALVRIEAKDYRLVVNGRRLKREDS